MPTSIKVPYAEKDQAKALGAKWNAEVKVWYVPDGLDMDPFQKWMPKVEVSASVTPAENATVREKEPGWLTLARCLGRGPLVLLHSTGCWSCGKEGLAVAMAFPLGDDEQAAISAAEAIWNQGIDFPSEGSNHRLPAGEL